MPVALNASSVLVKPEVAAAQLAADAAAQVTLEIQATMPSGVPEGTRRTVEENCRTLRFEGFGFEVE